VIQVNPSSHNTIRSGCPVTLSGLGDLIIAFAESTASNRAVSRLCEASANVFVDVGDACASDGYKVADATRRGSIVPASADTSLSSFFAKRRPWEKLSTIFQAVDRRFVANGKWMNCAIPISIGLRLTDNNAMIQCNVEGRDDDCPRRTPTAKKR
jgi:hypothetical protein